MNNMKKYNYTYITVNNLNDKSYIGVHSTDNLDDGYMGSGLALNRAIKKYGKENFSTLKINFYQTSDKSYKAEEQLVNIEWVQDSTTYNIATGGAGGFTGNHTEETKRKISVTHKGKTLSDKQKSDLSIHFKNLVRTDEHCENISKSLKGKPKTKEHNRKNSEAQQVPVYHKETGIFFKSLKEASEVLNIKYSTLKDNKGKYRREFEFI